MTEENKESEDAETKTKQIEEKKQEKKEMPDNVVFIGIKPFMNYINAVKMQFQDYNEVIISARGKNISRAVDVEEFIRKKFMKDENIEIAEIKLGSEEFEDRNKDSNRKVSVSSIEIRLIKKSN